MLKHLASCSRSPDVVRLQFQDKKPDSPEVSNNVAFMETSALSARAPPTLQLLSTSTRKATSSMITGFCDQVSTATQKDLDECFARAVFATGTPLSIVDNPFWISFLKKLRPAYTLPSRYVLSHTLLDREDKRISDLVLVTIAQAECLAIVSDGWTSINNTPIVNFMITTPEPVFLKSVTTGENRHTGQYIAQLLLEVIDEVGANKVLAVVTDNAANMKAAWTTITNTGGYEHIHCYGCVAHGLHLLATDICKLDSVDQLLTRVEHRQEQRASSSLRNISTFQMQPLSVSSRS